MYLQINDTMSVEEVQDRFNECFPFLRIAFYSKPHEPYEGSDKKYQYGGKEQIGNIRKKHVNAALEIKSWDTTAQVEKGIKKMFGLNTQIFRYDAVGCWIQTTLSDVLTLKQLSQFAHEGLLANQGVYY
jgi:hypothetical protein